MPESHDAARAVGQRIAAVRQARRLSQSALAARLGWPRDTLAHYEYGRRTLSVDRLVALTAELEVHPATLLIDDLNLATLVARLLDDAELRQQIRFFIDTLASE
jgi:transcriptional regulator with XRE-family HTH domain